MGYPDKKLGRYRKGVLDKKVPHDWQTNWKSKKSSKPTRHMRTKYRGKCTVCHGVIEVGQWVVFDKRSRTCRHDSCPLPKKTK